MRKAEQEKTAEIVAGVALDVGAGYDRLIQLAGQADYVLIGEASHGTHEFYATRAEITKRLITEQGFRILALEADWPDTLRIHRYVTGRTEEPDATNALGDFQRFPAWMWRNTVMVDVVEWLREWNRHQPQTKTGVFGMDLYSLHTSIAAVLEYLGTIDPDSAAHARQRYSCFDFFSQDPQIYGYATTHGRAKSCEAEVVAQLKELRSQYGEIIRHDGRMTKDEFFYAEQNARLVMNAEHYYRAMFHGRDTSWNLRDEHMVDTLDALATHFSNGRPQVIVWAHNSHVGDARATDMSSRGEWNVGQLVRQRHGPSVYLIGFSTFNGTVTAARDWGGPAERRQVRPGLPGSYEELFHLTGIPRLWVDLRQKNAATELLRHRRLQRAIGVIYRPETERLSHYLETCLPDQFDALIHLDETQALEPLERTSHWEYGELPDTYPEGL